MNLVYKISNIRTNHGGFTLIELLVSVAVLGILAAIALGNFYDLKARGFDAAASQDLGSVAIAEEAHYVDHAVYLSCSNSTDCISKLEGIKAVSDYVEVSVNEFGTYFIGTSFSTKGSGKVFTFNNAD